MDFFQSIGGLTIIARRNASLGGNVQINGWRFVVGFSFVI